jgi:DNA-binding response OmpR family regulator
MKILVVEDEHKIANSIKKGLEQESFTVDVAYDGNVGYDYASSACYDLIILDLMMPGLNGLEICKKLRSEKNNTPILILTAKDQLQDKVNGLNSGADDYLTKPFAFEELLARVKALRRRPKNIIESVFCIDDLTLDTNNFELSRAGKIIALSAKEYSLLEYLFRNQNKTLTKEQIISHVWDYDANILPNTVEVYMAYLRHKIDKAFPKSSPLIHTVRGFGYKLAKLK